MTKPREPRVEGLLKIAGEVLEGTRNRADLDAHGISIGEPIVGEQAKAMLLDELKKAEEFEAAVTALWSELVKQGAQDGSTLRLEVLFTTVNERAAAALAASISKDFGSDGWTATVTKSGDASKGLRVTVVTRPLVLGPEVIEALLEQMTDTAREFSCDLNGVNLPAPKKRSWWPFW
jgi:hypothetical protein